MQRFISNLLPHKINQTLTAFYFKGKLFLLIYLLVDNIILALSLKSNGFRGTHSHPVSLKLNRMKVSILPALTDNYMYLVSI